MAKGDINIIFTKDFAIHKKDSKVTFSRDLAHMLIGKGVAKVDNGKAVRPRKSKAKAKK